jgi:endonuclease/exonuclease/phosphatase family metal-dependent hydrolase
MLAKFFKGILFLVNLGVAFALFLATIGQYSSWPAFSILALGVPLLVVVNLLFVLFWLWVDWKKIWWSVTVLAIGFFFLGSFYRWGNTTDIEVKDSDVSVMSFNVLSFDGFGEFNNDNGASIVDFIAKENPDILCVQEFGRRKIWDLGRQYAYMQMSRNVEGLSRQAIFSHFPIINHGDVPFPNSPNNAMFADILVKADTIRVYNTHLQSFHIGAKRDFLEEKGAEGVVKRLYSGFKKQEEQAQLITENRATHSYKEIICGDFNNTSYSHAVRTLMDGMQDSFFEMGSGYGRTYKFKYYPLRIDFVLVDEALELTSHKTYTDKLSDHFPVKASFRLK